MFPLKEFKFWQGRARTAESYLHLSTGGYVCSVVLVMTEGNGNQLAKNGYLLAEAANSATGLGRCFTKYCFVVAQEMADIGAPQNRRDLLHAKERALHQFPCPTKSHLFDIMANRNSNFFS